MTSTIFQELIELELRLIKELLQKIDSKNEGHLKGTALELRLKNLFSKMIPSFCSFQMVELLMKKAINLMKEIYLYIIKTKLHSFY